MNGRIVTKGRLIGAGVVAVVGAACFAAGVSIAAQPHMENALAALQTARNELQIAESNKGGHRVNAIRLIDEAMGQVRAGIAAGS